MIDQREIFQCANLLIKQHGEDAAAHAGMRADELLAAGGKEGYATFVRIIGAIKSLQSMTAPPGRLH